MLSVSRKGNIVSSQNFLKIKWRENLKAYLLEKGMVGRNLFVICFAVLSSFVSSIVVADDADEQIEEIVVTGSYIKSSPADSPSPLSVITSADIENNHTVDMNELLTRLPYQSGGYIQAATFTGGGFQGR